MLDRLLEMARGRRGTDAEQPEGDGQETEQRRPKTAKKKGKKQKRAA